MSLTFESLLTYKNKFKDDVNELIPYMGIKKYHTIKLRKRKTEFDNIFWGLLNRISETKYEPIMKQLIKIINEENIDTFIDCFIKKITNGGDKFLTVMIKIYIELKNNKNLTTFVKKFMKQLQQKFNECLNYTCDIDNNKDAEKIELMDKQKAICISTSLFIGLMYKQNLIRDNIIKNILDETYSQFNTKIFSYEIMKALMSHVSTKISNDKDFMIKMKEKLNSIDLKNLNGKNRCNILDIKDMIKKTEI